MTIKYFRMKGFISIWIVALLASFPATAQNSSQLLQRLAGVKADTGKVLLLIQVAGSYTKENATEGIKYAEEALELSEKLNWQQGVRRANTALGDLYKSKGQYGKALKYYSKGVKLPAIGSSDDKAGRDQREEVQREQLLKEQQQREQVQREQLHREQLQKEQLKEELEKKQSELEERQKDLLLKSEEIGSQKIAIQKTKEELEKNAQEISAVQEQLSIAETEKQLQEARVNALIQEKMLQQSEIESKKKEKRIYTLAVSLMVVVLLFAIYVLLNQRKSNRLISQEKRKSDELLLNILPVEVANELKEKGEAEAKLYNEVSVLFSDFVGFTHIAEQLSPQDLVTELHTCFKAFDAIIFKYGIEKIKTVGDAYLAVAGLPASNPDHALNVVNAAIEICEFMDQRYALRGDQTFTVRIGINSGSVVAGIVGVRKFAYDIWGDTVNIAARMEQNSEAGKINVSGDTYELIKDRFDCEYRGKIHAKNKGETDMYFVTGRKNQA